MNEGSRFFIDTNIFVYSFDQTAPDKARIASQLIRKALTTQKGTISFQVVQEFFNLALRRFARPMNAADVEQYFIVTLRPLLAVHSSPTLYLEAMQLQSRNQLSWYDSLIVAAAQQAQCEVLQSEDLQHGQKFGSLRIENPFR
jgi:predicted nucleic acid-binding protein